MLLIAYGGRGARTRIRERAAEGGIARGGPCDAGAVRAGSDAEDRLTTLHIPGLTGRGNRIAGSSAGQKQLAKIRGGRAELSVVHTNKGGLPDYGNAPTLKPDGVWINSAPFTLASLHGKVVLID